MNPTTHLVICINNDNVRDCLTIGKIYEWIEDDELRNVKNDKGESDYYNYNRRFKPLCEVRENKLNTLLN